MRRPVLRVMLRPFAQEMFLLRLAGPLPSIAAALPIVIGDGSGATPEPGVLDVSLSIQETAGLARAGEPVTSGVPMPLSVNLTDLSAVRLLDGNGRPVPAQFSSLARWGGAPDDVGDARLETAR